jgi:hypothetical protein
LRSKATNFVSVLLNPISDPDPHQPSKHPPSSSVSSLLFFFLFNFKLNLRLILSS